MKHGNRTYLRQKTCLSITFMIMIMKHCTASQEDHEIENPGSDRYLHLKQRNN